MGDSVFMGFQKEGVEYMALIVPVGSGLRNWSSEIGLTISSKSFVVFQERLPNGIPYKPLIHIDKERPHDADVIGYVASRLRDQIIRAADDAFALVEADAARSCADAAV